MTLRADAPASPTSRPSDPSKSSKSSESSKPSKTARALEVSGGILGVGIMFAMAAWVVATSLQQDFAAYYTAGRARSLGLDPYVNHLAAGGPWDGIGIYRHSRFLYAPLVAELFRPLAALPYLPAKALFTVASLLALGVTIGIVGRDSGLAARAASPQPRHLGLALLAAAVWPPIFLTIERGQIDLLLLPLLAAAWRWRERALTGGMCLALCALAKPLVLAALPLLLVAGGRRGAALVGAAVTFVVLLMGLPALVSGPQLSRQYLTEVLPRAATYGEGGPEEWLLPSDQLTGVVDDLVGGTARIDGHGRVFAQEIGAFRRSASLTRLLSGDQAPSTALSLGIVAGLGGVLASVARRRRDSPAWFWGMLAVGILAAPVSWAMSLTWTFPLFLAFPANTRDRNRWLSPTLPTMFAAGFLGLVTPVGWVVLGLVAVVAAAALPRFAPREVSA